MNMARPIIFTTLLLSATIVCGQSGIRFTMLDFGTASKRFHPNLLLGFDRDITDRTAFGIDLIKSYSFNPEGISDEVSNGTFYTYYATQVNYWGLQYRSHYFFSGTGYIASSIGFRSISIKIAGSTSNYSSYTTSFNSFSRTASTTTFPIGIRMGFRSDLDGYFGDIHAGIGYNIGGNVNLGNEMLVDTDVISKLWLTVGYALGIGW